MKVDLPAPLVPMRPTTSRCPSVRSTWSTATRPPKRTETPLVRSAGTPSGSSSRSASSTTRARDDGLGGLDRLRLRQAAREHGEHEVAQVRADLEETPREVQEEDQQADAARQEPRRVGVSDQRGEADHPERADHGTRDRRQPADHRDRDDAQRLFGRERVGPELHLEPAVQAPSEAGDRARDAEGHQLHPDRRDRERRGLLLVVAHGDERTADPAPPDACEDHRDEEQHDEAQVVVVPLVAHPVGAGQPDECVIAEQEGSLEQPAARHHREGERRDREEQPADAQGRDPDHHGHERHDDRRDDHRGFEGDGAEVEARAEEIEAHAPHERRREDRGEADERELAERQLPGPPGEQRERHRHDRVDEHQRQRELRRRLGEDQGKHDAQRDRDARPTSWRRRTTQ